MYIPVSQDNKVFYSEGFVVKLLRDDGTDWVANFEQGLTEFNEVYSFQTKNEIIVIAGGLGYVMNPNQFQPIQCFGFAISEVLQIENGSLICCDDTSILIVDNETEEIWESDRLSFDGIKELKYKKGIVTGKSYNPINLEKPWSSFTFNIKSKEIIGGSYRNFKKTNTHITQLSKSSKVKSWWKKC